MVLFVQSLDSLTSHKQQMLILGHDLLLRIAQIRQKSEVEIYIPVCQVSNLEPFQQIHNFFRAGQNGWHYYQSSQLLRNA